MAAVTEQFVYQIIANNTGTQDGTNVIITDTYPTGILSVVDADGGIVDTESGTITWSIDKLAVGEEHAIAIEVRVLDDAYLDTADQLFTNSVNIIDDDTNGQDPTPANNSASHADMLLAGPGDPAALSSSPYAIDTAFQSRVFASIVDEFEPPKYEKRFISSETMLSTQSEGSMETRHRAYEDDPLHGGDLLDVFQNPVQLCEVHWVDNPYTDGQAETLPANDLINMFVPDESAEPARGEHSSLEHRFIEESEKINGVGGDWITQLMAELVKTETEAQ